MLCFGIRYRRLVGPLACMCEVYCAVLQRSLNIMNLKLGTLYFIVIWIAMQRNKLEIPMYWLLSPKIRKNIIEAAAKALALDLLPLSFCHEKVCMMQFSMDLIQLGQRYSAGANIYVKKLLPYGKKK